MRLSTSSACDTVGFDEQQTNMMSFTVSIGCNAAVRATTTNWVVSTSYGHPAPIPYVITGFLNSDQVFSFRNTQGNTFGDFATIANPHRVRPVIHLSNPAACCSNPMGLDNIRLSF